MSKVEIAVWHPSLRATDIENRVGAAARIAFSAGDKKKLGNGVYTETYCRFNLGNLGRAKCSRDLSIFERFREFFMSEDFSVPNASCAAYFSLEDDESEIYIGHDALSYLTTMGLGVVFR